MTGDAALTTWFRNFSAAVRVLSGLSRPSGCCFPFCCETVSGSTGQFCCLRQAFWSSRLLPRPLRGIPTGKRKSWKAGMTHAAAEAIIWCGAESLTGKEKTSGFMVPRIWSAAVCRKRNATGWWRERAGWSSMRACGMARHRGFWWEEPISLSFCGQSAETWMRVLSYCLRPPFTGFRKAWRSCQKAEARSGWTPDGWKAPLTIWNCRIWWRRDTEKSVKRLRKRKSRWKMFPSGIRERSIWRWKMFRSNFRRAGSWRSSVWTGAERQPW